MSDKRRDEFLALVKAAHDAVDEYAEDRLSGRGDWFTRGLDLTARMAVEELLAFGNRQAANYSLRPTTETKGQKWRYWFIFNV